MDSWQQRWRSKSS